MRVFFTDINKKSIYLLIFIIIAYTLWYLAERDMKEKSKSINQNYKSTIGLVVDFKKNKTCNVMLQVLFLNKVQLILNFPPYLLV